MTDATKEPSILHGYHAHVYYDQHTEAIAVRLRQALGANFAVKLGQLNERPVGPHPISQFAAIFETEAFQSVVPWLMLNRDGLDILIHPLTDDMVDDHTIYALWLGNPVTLRLETMRRQGYGAALLPADESSVSA
jgi:DOPA 4,5-dioxygenase